MREGLFSTLVAIRGPLAGVRFLDLYAGSGAVGLEALSRGAAHVLLVERDRRAVATIAANIKILELDGASTRASDVGRLVTEAPDRAYDIVFADPPYDLTPSRLNETLRGLRDNRWLAHDADVVVERATRDGPVTWPDGYEADRRRAYGEGTLWYARVPQAPRVAPADPAVRADAASVGPTSRGVASDQLDATDVADNGSADDAGGDQS